MVATHQQTGNRMHSDSEAWERAKRAAAAKRTRDVLEREYTEAEHARATERFYRDLEAEQEADRYAVQADADLGPLEKSVIMYPHPPADNDSDGKPADPSKRDAMVLLAASMILTGLILAAGELAGYVQAAHTSIGG